MTKIVQNIIDLSVLERILRFKLQLTVSESWVREKYYRDCLKIWNVQRITNLTQVWLKTIEQPLHSKQGLLASQGIH